MLPPYITFQTFGKNFGYSSSHQLNLDFYINAMKINNFSVYLVLFVCFILNAACSGGKTEVAAENNTTVAQKPVVKEENKVEESSDPLERLIEGNKRFVAGKSIHPREDLARRAGLAKGQKPFAVLLSCSDSRVPPEIVFDQGIGDLFVVRIAGNIFDEAVDGSIEYAVEHLGAKLIVVMGHESCGAVKAAIDHNREAHIQALAKAIEPILVKVEKQPGDKLDNAVRANVRYVVEQIKDNKPILAKHIEEKKVRVAGAYYDLDSGEVTLVE